MMWKKPYDTARFYKTIFRRNRICMSMKSLLKKTLIEAEAVSPEAYVKENGRFPVLESMCNESGDVVIVTGDNKGSFVRYTFTE